MNKPVCLFDSGIGGLTVLKKLIERFPSENYIYLADLANVPFGDKTKDQIRQIVSNITTWLITFNPKIIIMACNTSSTLVLDEYRKKLNIPVFGMIESIAKEIAKSKVSCVSAWATKLVTENNGYKKAIQKLNLDIKVEEIACPKLVPLVENLSSTKNEKEKILLEYLDKTNPESDLLILGCTHYPLIQNELKSLTKLKIIDPADSLLKDLETYLTKDKAAQGKINLYATSELEKLKLFSNIYLGQDFETRLIKLNQKALSV